MKKLIATATAILLTACVSSPICYAADDNIRNAKASAASVEYAGDSYDKYLHTFSGAEYAASEVKYGESCVFGTESREFAVEIPSAGFYSVGMSYRAVDKSTDDIKIGVEIDGSCPYEQAGEFEFPRMWRNEEKVRTDSLGNEFAHRQVPYEEFYRNYALRLSDGTGEKYLVYLTKGSHTVSIIPVKGSFELEYLVFGSSGQPVEYSAPTDNEKLYDGEPVIIEGESAALKSKHYLIAKSDTATVAVTPHTAKVNSLNYIGGNWKNAGETLVWNTPELEEGYYRIGFSFKQNAVIGSMSYRSLLIDGTSPFKEAEQISFGYADGWQQSFFKSASGTPYLIYFTKGVHTISLSVTSGDISKVRTLISDAIAQLGELYIDINMITGENVDVYRDYELFSQIPDMETRLKDIRDKLNSAAERLSEITGQKSGSNYSVIMNMVEIINQMLKNKFEAHRYKSSYYSNYCSVSSVLHDLKSMPLDLDKIALTSASRSEPFEKSGFFEQALYSVQRFFVSFSKDYNGISDGDSDGIKLWVNTGRDQAQVMSSLIERSFTADTKISVDLKLVNATMIQAILSGNGPDCAVMNSRSEPVNLAMRGVLYDLSQFSDCEEVLKRFQAGAELPYRYKDGLYALPDTQSYFMMFYRRDILEQLGIDIPVTWDQFGEAYKILARNNMSVWLPNNVATDTAQVNAGVGSVNIFPSLLLQNGLSLYTEDGKSTNLLSADVMTVFGKWTDYYSKMKFPVTLDFYNRFRVGTTPLGIAVYTTYTTLKVAAPELDSLWGFTAVPGTVRQDGSISRASSGGGTGCFILKSTKAPQKAWEFLKWWTSADTQLSYSNDIESVIGPAGRVAVANVEAIKGLSWDTGMLDELLSAWSQVEEIPEYPGSYYVSRSIYQSFWNVVNANKNTKDMLMKYGREANEEISRKWKQYQSR